MKVVRSYLLIVFVSTSLLVPASGGQTNQRRDGNWWLSLTEEFRLKYIVGFFDGMDLGRDFSIWKWLRASNKALDPCLDKVAESYSEYNEKYLKNVTNGQLVDGLDNFYSDYRNRRITLKNAVWLVVNGIAGTPQDQLNKMIENWRRNTVQ